MDGRLDVDEIWKNLGTFGKFQKRQLTIALISIIPLPFHLLSTIFIAYRPPHFCNDTDVDIVFEDDSLFRNTTYRFIYNKCTIDVYTNDTNSSIVKTTTCLSGHRYPVPSDRTLVTEWDLVCKGAELAEFSQTLVILGQAIGAVVFTSLADKFGRKPVHMFGHISLFAISFSISWSPNYTVFAILRFMLGTAQQATSLTTTILCLEILPLKSRFIGDSLGSMFWSTGATLLALFGYTFRNLSWRYLQMALALCSAYSILEYWIMEESVRWLLANGKTKEAERILRKAANMNKKDFDEVVQAATLKLETLNDRNSTSDVGSMMSPHCEDISDSLEQHVTEELATTQHLKQDKDVPLTIVSKTPLKRYNVFTIFHHKRLFLNAVIMWYAWIVNSMVYYALSLTSSALSGNRFLNYFLIAVIEFPAALTEYFLVNSLGRRKMTILFHAIVAVSLSVSTACHTFAGGNDTLRTMVLIFNLLGKYGISVSFSVLFLYTPELYPTNMRNAGIGVTSSFARIGGMFAPFAGPLAERISWGPGAISAGMCLLVVYLVTFLPETKGYELPTTIEELKQWHKEDRKIRKKKPDITRLT